VLASRWFEPVSGSVIFANALCLGISIDKELQGRDTSVLSMLEHFFLGFFIFELLIVVSACGFGKLAEGWTMFDAVIIVCGVVSLWIVDPIMARMKIEDNDIVKGAQGMLILRMLRLLRLVRAVRLINSFNALWKLTESFLRCAPTMFSALLMVLMMIYIFACVGAEFISKQDWDDAEGAELVHSRFSTLPLIMLSLVQFITGDSISGLYYPLVAQKPALIVYFVALLLAVTLALMNLVTAMVVEDAISNARMDDEMEIHFRRSRAKELRPKIGAIFDSIDINSDDAAELSEALRVINDGFHVPRELQGIITESRIVDLWDALDSNGDGRLSRQEFVDGLCHMALLDIPVETVQMMHLQRTLLIHVLVMMEQLGIGPPPDLKKHRS